MFWMVEEGNMSRGISLLSGLGEAMGSPLRVVVLYLSPSPRTISWPALAIEMPDNLATLSWALEMPFIVISLAPMFSIAKPDIILSFCSACRDSRFFLAVTTAFIRASLSGSR